MHHSTHGYKFPKGATDENSEGAQLSRSGCWGGIPCTLIICAATAKWFIGNSFLLSELVEIRVKIN